MSLKGFAGLLWRRKCSLNINHGRAAQRVRESGWGVMGLSDLGTRKGVRLETAVERLIRRARRRLFLNLLVRHSSEALCAGLAGMVLLLVAGTQVLDWPWIAALAVASLAPVLRTTRRLPSAYATAQILDQRLGLEDHLATAFYYSRPECSRGASNQIRAAQQARAERLAQGAECERAIPLARPKSLYAVAALFLAASSLFALRYGITRSLDLRPPLAALLLDAFHLGSDQRLAAERKPKPTSLDEALKQYGPSLDSENDRRGPRQAAPGSSPESAQAQRESRNAERAAGDRGGSKSGQAGMSHEAEKQSSGQPGSASIEQANQNQNASSQAAASGEQRGQSGASQQAANSQHESNSLLDRVKDAVSNLMSRLKSEPQSGSSQQQMAGNGRQKPNPSPRGPGQNGNQGASRFGQQPQSGDTPGDEQGQGAEQAQSGPGRQGGSESEQAFKQGQSGIGRQDGNKEIREAQQLAAMGKISEIIGRRSHDLTGEAMVEVASGQQRLQTPYSDTKASHADSGGEIHRDEIPLAYQAFVRRYFDEVRKKPPASRKP
jgi:hypothetical protein